MAKVRWPAEVISQLNAIAAYLRRRDPVAAKQFPERLFALGNSLADFPHRGRPADNGVRQLPGVPPYVLSYIVTDDHVTIVDVRHGRRRPYRHRR